MKQKIFLNIFLIYFSTVLISCNSEQQDKNIQNNNYQVSNYTSIADTIITDVLIKNPNSQDTWEEYCLRNLDKDILVNRIFKGIYSKELQAFDFFSEDSLSIEKIRDLEKSDEFKRSLIAKVQFEEKWLLNIDKLKMHKEVYSIMLAYEIYNSKGEIKGYKPAFKVYINH